LRQSSPPPGPTNCSQLNRGGADSPSLLGRAGPVLGFGVIRLFAGSGKRWNPLLVGRA